jgi:hypothetical protein
MAELQHAEFETVLGIATQAPFPVGFGGENTFDIGDSFTPLRQGSSVVGAWYEPIDNVPDFKSYVPYPSTGPTRTRGRRLDLKIASVFIFLLPNVRPLGSNLSANPCRT